MIEANHTHSHCYKQKDSPKHVPIYIDKRKKIFSKFASSRTLIHDCQYMYNDIKNYDTSWWALHDTLFRFSDSIGVFLAQIDFGIVTN